MSQCDLFYYNFYKIANNLLILPEIKTKVS